MPAQQKYLQMFLEEAGEILSKLHSRVLALDGLAEPRATLQSALRHAHTLKGGARMVGLNNLSRAAHDLENSLKILSARDGGVPAPDINRFVVQLDRMGRALGLVAAGRLEEALAWDLLAGDGASAGTASALTSGAERGTGTEGSREASREPERRGATDRVRVSVEKLDELQNLVDDLTLHRTRILARMGRFKKAIAAIDLPFAASGDGVPESLPTPAVRSLLEVLAGREFSAFLDELHTLDQVVSEVQEQVLDLRMVPLMEVLDDYQRIVRNLAHELGKEVTLTVDGQFTEIDKRLLESVRAPLMHLVRNAIDHGIEPPSERVAAGKPAAGTLTLRAYHRGSAVVLEVEDDGRGLDPDKIRGKAVEQGILGGNDAPPSDQEALYLLCEPGFTTRDTVTEVSGRGIGLDVVKVRLEKLKGSLSIHSENGRFTRFRMYLPLSVSSLSTLVVGVERRSLAVPSTFIDGCLKVDSQALADGEGTWEYGGQRQAVVSLARVLGMEPQPGNGRTALVAVRFRGKSMLLQVDRLEAESEVVLKPLGAHVRDVPFISGIAFLPDGTPAPVVNVPDLHAGWPALEESCRYQTIASDRRPVVLVVDDSMTTRHMEANAVGALGYEVLQAADGEEAWALLQERSVDLVVTDVEMPKMGGLELSRRIRESQRTAHVPVVAVSYRVEEADLGAGHAAGVDAYIRKDRFSQRILGATLQQLLAGRLPADRGVESSTEDSPRGRP